MTSGGASFLKCRAAFWPPLTWLAAKIAALHRRPVARALIPFRPKCSPLGGRIERDSSTALGMTKRNAPFFGNDDARRRCRSGSVASIQTVCVRYACHPEAGAARDREVGRSADLSTQSTHTMPGACPPSHREVLRSAQNDSGQQRRAGESWTWRSRVTVLPRQGKPSPGTEPLLFLRNRHGVRGDTLPVTVPFHPCIGEMISVGKGAPRRIFALLLSDADHDSDPWPESVD